MHRSIGDTGHMCLAFEKVFVSSFLKKAHVYLCSLQVSSSLRIPWLYPEKIGFHADFDQQVREDLRFVQLTPPGSACSIVIGVGITTMQPGSLEGLLMVVPDVKAVREELVTRGVDISEIDVQEWGSFASFRDPDGNSWSLQQVPSRS